ncbi:uncharacterized protein LOC105793165 [Gossypium raimondii]|uniref:uncharacterized protein LOC105793165 n=1 Tax=Gossypium raimondii TaxID=29730 RepID=UPI00063B08E5|nr:uncharacterized protein LOC105793165 [Gossypium raimondii]
MCKRFEDDLNEDIKLLVGILEIKEFMVLVKRACKAEELGKEKRKTDFEARDSLNGRACFKCGSLDHFIRECPKLANQDIMQNTRPINTAARGRPPETRVISEARAPARAYATHTHREEASSVDVITGTFTLYDTTVIALIDSGSTHSYVCETLLSSKTLLVESTEFVIRVSNPLGKCVLIDKVGKNCPLMIQDFCFPTDLMLLSFDKFDIILGMDWLTLQDAIVNCKQKMIDLKCQNNEIIRIELDALNGLPAMISSMLA